jgi:Tol biopolymer transport system component
MNPRLSPDGRRLVIQSASASRATDAWLFDVASPSRAPFTRLGTVLNPTWTPDGNHVVYLSQANGGSSLWVQRADAREPARRIVEADGLFAPEVTPDGRTVVFQRGSGRTLGIWAAPLDGSAPPRPIVVERFNAYMPAISPDGRWVAYAANPSGDYEVYVRPFPGPGAATKISDGGGTEPAWSHDGQRLFYRASRSMLAADLALRPTVVVNRHSTLFTAAFDDDDQPMPHRNYDVSADGRSFVMIATAPEAVRETVVSIGWLDGVRARLSSGSPGRHQ